MSWQEEDLKLLLSAVDELSDYLNSPINDWKLSPSRLILTPGRIMLAKKRVSVLKSSTADVNSLSERIDRLIELKKGSWQRKIDAEVPRRILIWKNMLADYAEDVIDGSYPAQVANRVMIELLFAESRFLQASSETGIEKLDNELRGLSKNGDFIWDELLQPVFPLPDYWYLYIQKLKG